MTSVILALSTIVGVLATVLIMSAALALSCKLVTRWAPPFRLAIRASLYSLGAFILLSIAAGLVARAVRPVPDGNSLTLNLIVAALMFLVSVKINQSVLYSREGDRMSYPQALIVTVVVFLVSFALRMALNTIGQLLPEAGTTSTTL